MSLEEVINLIQSSLHKRIVANSPQGSPLSKVGSGTLRDLDIDAIDDTEGETDADLRENDSYVKVSFPHKDAQGSKKAFKLDPYFVIECIANSTELAAEDLDTLVIIIIIIIYMYIYIYIYTYIYILYS